MHRKWKSVDSILRYWAERLNFSKIWRQENHFCFCFIWYLKSSNLRKTYEFFKSKNSLSISFIVQKLGRKRLAWPHFENAIDLWPMGGTDRCCRRTRSDFFLSKDASCTYRSVDAYIKCQAKLKCVLSCCTFF